MIFFHKALIGNREVLTGIEKEFLREIKGANLRRFRYLYNDVTQLIEMVGTHREVLTGTLDIYLTSVSNNMNEVMKRLTVITSFILIPTLISGIYGMNFKGMDEFNWPYGQFFAYGMMFISTLAVFFYFKKNKFM